MSELPTPCPQCDTTLETRDDVMVHLFQHWGDGDIRPLENAGERHDA